MAPVLILSPGNAQGLPHLPHGRELMGQACGNRQDEKMACNMTKEKAARQKQSPWPIFDQWDVQSRLLNILSQNTGGFVKKMKENLNQFHPQVAYESVATSVRLQFTPL